MRVNGEKQTTRHGAYGWISTNKWLPPGLLPPRVDPPESSPVRPLVNGGYVGSGAEFRRLVSQGGVQKNGERVILTCQPDLDAKEARLLLNRLIEAPRTAAVILYPIPGEGDAGRICYLLGRSPDSTADCKYLCDLLNGLYNGKGGGKPAFAQGSGRLLPNWQETAGGLEKIL